jgi:hypothetical protein
MKTEDEFDAFLLFSSVETQDLSQDYPFICFLNFPCWNLQGRSHV